MTTAAFPFATAAESYRGLAEETDDLTNGLSAVLAMLDDQAGLPADAINAVVGHCISRSNTMALAMSETTTACSAQNSFDEALAQAPTPADCDAAWDRARAVWSLARTGGCSKQVALAAQSEAAAMQRQRDAAVAAHEAATSRTEFPTLPEGEWNPKELPGEPGKKKEGDDGSIGRGNDSGVEGADTGEDQKPDLRPLPGDPNAEAQLPITPAPDLKPLPLIEPATPEEVAGAAWLSGGEPTVAGTELSTAAPSATPAAYQTTIPQPQAVNNSPTVASPSFMQASTPPATGPRSLGQMNPHGQPHPRHSPSAQTRAGEDRRTQPLDQVGAAAVVAPVANAVTSTPTAPTPPTAQPPTAMPAPHPSAQTPVGGGPGMMPGGGAGQGKSTAAPKIEAARQPTLEEMFDAAMRETPDAPVRDGLLGPILNPHLAGTRA